MVSPIRDAAINGMVEELLAKRRRELEFVPKARFEDWDQERTDDL